jgi:cell division protein FtsZ
MPSEFERMINTISESIDDADLIILVCSMEDPQGFEAARVFAEVAREKGVLSICYVFLPHGFDKVDGVHEANRDLQRLRLIVDIVAVLPNRVHISVEALAQIIGETIELTTTAGLVNVDVADLKSTVKGGNVALIGIGEARGDDRLKEAVRRALSHRLMLIDYPAISKVVVNVTGGEDMTIDEAEGASRWLAKLVKEDAKIVWGAEVDPTMKGMLRVFVVAAATPVEVLLYIYTKD